jgi:hypothetical protein
VDFGLFGSAVFRVIWHKHAFGIDVDDLSLKKFEIGPSLLIATAAKWYNNI